MKKFIFGIGTGRCGTTSLSHLLNGQFGANITHEMSGDILLPWEFNKKEYDRYIGSLCNRKGEFIGDVSFYLINYVPQIIKDFPESKILVLKRNKQETINSFIKKIGPLEHWVSNPRMFSAYDKCFPKFDFESQKIKRISLYYDLYYSLLEQIDCDQIMLLNTNELNDEKKIKKVLKFCGFEEPKFSIKHLNRT